MQRPTLVAVDTNILMRLANEDGSTIDALELLKRRLKPAQFLVPPTVLDEIVAKAVEDNHALAIKALQELRGKWGFFPQSLNAVQEAIVNNAVLRLRDSGLLPYEERNDALVIAESAVLNCVLLVSRDSHLFNIDRDRLAYLFRQLDLPVPLIASPDDLLKKFYR
jgi:predicted nucleic acid-binding protein